MFPSSIISFSTKVNGQVIDAGDINSPQTEITALETKVGTDGSADATSLDYLIKNASSNGGGHVQTANKGGTGQTSYTKGDLLVASSSSVIGKLSVSSVAGDVLVADPNQTSGMKWGPVVANKVAVTTSSVSAGAGITSVATVLWSASILGSTLGINNGVRFTGLLTKFNAAANFTAIARYGNNIAASVAVSYDAGAGSSIIGGAGIIQGMIVGNGTDSLQRSFINMNVATPTLGGTNDARIIQTAIGTGSGSSSVVSSATQNLVITGVFADGGAKNSVMAGLFVVEKIV